MTTEIYQADCLEWMRNQPDRCVSLTLCSPPYEDCRTYGIGFRLRRQEWVDWMIPRVVEMCRVTDGIVLINMSGKVRNWKYTPVVEWLVADLTRHHGIVCGPAPYVFYRVGIPGSGSTHYQRRDWEPVYSFAFADRLPLRWSDNTAMGHPPKWAPGGEMSHRVSDGARANQWGHSIDSGATNVTAEEGFAGSAGTMEMQGYSVPVLANPGNVIQENYTAEQVAFLFGEPSDVIKCNVGGGQMGSKKAHDNEAPFPERLAEFFIRSFCPPDGGTVLDPFSGSGTTVAVAKRAGRNAIGIDIRESQVELSRSRVASVQVELFG